MYVYIYIYACVLYILYYIVIFRYFIYTEILYMYMLIAHIYIYIYIHTPCQTVGSWPQVVLVLETHSMPMFPVTSVEWWEVNLLSCSVAIQDQHRWLLWHAKKTTVLQMQSGVAWNDPGWKTPCGGTPRAPGCPVDGGKDEKPRSWGHWQTVKNTLETPGSILKCQWCGVFKRQTVFSSSWGAFAGGQTWEDGSQDGFVSS